MKCFDIEHIGVCSWSLDNDISLLNKIRDKTGVSCTHLSLNPVLDGQSGYIERFLNAGWNISATMAGFEYEDYSTLESIRLTGGIVPHAVWPKNMQRIFDAIKITASLKVPYLEFHFGFIDAADRSAYKLLAQKTRILADAAAENNIIILMETGQETAAVLSDFIEYVNHPAVAVNFDPANMLLYGQGCPIEAVQILKKWIRHIHIKDAVPSTVAGKWGTEVPWGTGKVNAKKFLKALANIGYKGVLSVEREAGENRLQDIESAVKQIASWSDENG